MMETGTFPKDDVTKYISTYFVALKYESGRDSEQFLRFGLKATPTFIVLDAKGNEIHRMVGYYKPDDFIKLLDEARARAS